MLFRNSFLNKPWAYALRNGRGWLLQKQTRNKTLFGCSSGTNLRPLCLSQTGLVLWQAALLRHSCAGGCWEKVATLHVIRVNFSLLPAFSPFG